MWPAPAANIASRTASAFSAGTKTTHLSRSAPTGARRQRPRRPSVRAPRRARRTPPGTAASALVWAVNSARRRGSAGAAGHPSRCSAATVSTPRSSSGWCASSSPPSGTSATTSAVASTATVTDSTVSAGSPQTRPDRVPVLGQPRRIRRVEHVDDVGQPHAHRITSRDRVDQHRPVRRAPRRAGTARPDRRRCRNAARRSPCRPAAFASARHRGR